MEKVAEYQTPSGPPSSALSSILVFGCGYLGREVVKSSVFQGHRVWATTRRRSKMAAIEQMGAEPVLADWTDHRTLRGLPPVDRILVAVSYDRHDRQSRYDSQVGGLGRLLEVVPAETHLCYISTTGVYHQTDGSWVDECSPARPRREGGRVHLQAEALLHRRRPNSLSTILRLAGIYGPGRVPRVADVVAGRPIASPPAGYLNLIHVADAASVIQNAWSRQRNGMYVVADDQPMIRREFYAEIARQCGSPAPQFASTAANAPVTMRAESNKRVWNRRMKRELLGQLQYPTYREGLVSVLKDNS